MSGGEIFLSGGAGRRDWGANAPPVQMIEHALLQ